MAEWATLEMSYIRKGIRGSNPLASANFQNSDFGRLLPRPRGVYPAPNLFWCGARARQKQGFYTDF